MKIGQTALVILLIVTVIGGCMSKATWRESVLQMSGEAALGFFDRHGRVPTSDELIGVLHDENKIQLSEEDEFEVRVSPTLSRRGKKMLDVRWTTSDGSVLNRSFEIGKFD